MRDAVFGILDVNCWHNVVHILTGMLGLLACGAGAYAARTYATALGIVLGKPGQAGLPRVLAAGFVWFVTLARAFSGHDAPHAQRFCDFP